jgi:hypothetical protein
MYTTIIRNVLSIGLLTGIYVETKSVFLVIFCALIILKGEIEVYILKKQKNEANNLLTDLLK